VPTRIGIGAKDVLVYGTRVHSDVVTVIRLQEAQLKVEKQTHLTVGHVKKEKRIELKLSVTLMNGRVKGE
tara:strand:+ start:326 stop:535 length:210 start_codon:yes stop_codon:yes gene_type:complete